MFIGFSAYAEDDKDRLFKADYWRNATLEDVSKEVEKGIDFKDFKKEWYGANVFMRASGFTKDPKIIQLLIDSGANIKEKSKQKQWTSLMFAAALNKNPDVIDVLIKNGADIEMTNGFNEETALLLAANRKNTIMMERLIELGANIYARNRRGATVWDLMKYPQNKEEEKDGVYLYLKKIFKK